MTKFWSIYGMKITIINNHAVYLLLCYAPIPCASCMMVMSTLNWPSPEDSCTVSLEKISYRIVSVCQFSMIFFVIFSDIYIGNFFSFTHLKLWLQRTVKLFSYFLMPPHDWITISYLEFLKTNSWILNIWDRKGMLRSNSKGKKYVLCSGKIEKKEAKLIMLA